MSFPSNPEVRPKAFFKTKCFKDSISPGRDYIAYTYIRKISTFRVGQLIHYVDGYGIWLGKLYRDQKLRVNTYED